jgi:hypothetical protein
VLLVYLTPRIARGINRGVVEPMLEHWTPADEARPAAASWVDARSRQPRVMLQDRPLWQRVLIWVTSVVASPYLVFRNRRVMLRRCRRAAVAVVSAVRNVVVAQYRRHLRPPLLLLRRMGRRAWVRVSYWWLHTAVPVLMRWWDTTCAAVDRQALRIVALEKVLVESHRRSAARRRAAMARWWVAARGSWRTHALPTVLRCRGVALRWVATIRRVANQLRQAVWGFVRSVAIVVRDDLWRPAVRTIKGWIRTVRWVITSSASAIYRRALAPVGRTAKRVALLVAWVVRSSAAWLYRSVLRPTGLGFKSGVLLVARAVQSSSTALFRFVLRPVGLGIRSGVLFVAFVVRTSAGWLYVHLLRPIGAGAKHLTLLMAWAVKISAGVLYVGILRPTGNAVKAAALGSAWLVTTASNTTYRLLLLPVGRAASDAARVTVTSTAQVLRMSGAAVQSAAQAAVEALRQVSSAVGRKLG